QQTADLRTSIEDMVRLARGTQASFVIATLEGTSGKSCSMCHSLSGNGAEEGEFQKAASRVGALLQELQAGGDPAVPELKKGLDDCSSHYRRYLEYARRKEFQPAHDTLAGKMVQAVQNLYQLTAALVGRQRAELEAYVLDSRSQVSRGRSAA